mgnify:CR=1 FL=1
MQAQLFQSAPINTSLRLDPRTKLLMMFILSVIMINGDIRGKAVYIRLVLAVIPFILLLFSGRIKASLFYAALYAAVWFAEAFLVYTTSGAANILIVMLAGMVGRFIPCAVMGYYLMTTTRVSEFVAAMEQIHMPRAIIIPLSVMFRFFPTIAEESRAINDAMRMRGIGINSLSKNPVALFEYRLIPLLMSIVKIGGELSAAALTRGLGGPVKRTNICKIGFGVWDFCMAAVMIAALAAYVLIQRGTL